MKKLTSILCVILLCITILSTLVFATDAKYNFSDVQAIYASNSAEIAKAIKQNTGSLSAYLKEHQIFIDNDTIMPLYCGSFYDYAKTGTFQLSPYCIEEGQAYIANVKDNEGAFAGMVQFTVDGNRPDIYIYKQTKNEAESCDYRLNAKQISALLEQENFDKNTIKAKLALIDGLGYVYHLSDAEKEGVIITDFQTPYSESSANAKYNLNFNKNGLIWADSALLQKATEALAKIEKTEEEFIKLEPNKKPHTGDQTTDMDASTSAPILIFGVTLTIIVFIVVLVYKKKKIALQKR